MLTLLFLNVFRVIIYSRMREIANDFSQIFDGENNGLIDSGAPAPAQKRWLFLWSRFWARTASIPPDPSGTTNSPCTACQG